MDSKLHARRTLRHATKAFQTTQPLNSVLQLANTLLPLAVLCAVAIALLSTAPYLSFLLAIPMAGLVIRTFMLQHDCSHGSFFRSEATNNRIGFVLGIITMTPHACWKKFHLMHHASNGNLGKRGFGDIKTLTVEEYTNTGLLERIGYRIYRHPVVLFGVGAFLFFVIRQRLTLKIKSSWRHESWSVHLTNAGLVVIVWCILAFADHPLGVLALYATVMFLAAGVGVWLFYIQHQFPDAYWKSGKAWSFHDAAIDGSSFYDLNSVAHWITANIGFHHIHHLNPKIPNYAIAKCYQEIPDLQDCRHLKFGPSLRYARLALWDNSKSQMVSFKDTFKGRLQSTSAACK